MPRQKKIAPARGYHKVISTGNGEFANYNKVVQAFGCTGSGRGLLRHSINEPLGPREYERMENIPQRPPPRPKSDALLTELSNLNADSGSSHYDFDSDDRSDISCVDKQGNTRSWINSAASFNPRNNYHGNGSRTRYGVENVHYHSQPHDLEIMSRLEYQLHLKERQLAFTTSIVEQQNRFLYEQLDGFVTMPPMRRLYPDNIDKRSVRLKPDKPTDKDLPVAKPATAKKKPKKPKIASTENDSSDRLLVSEVNNGPSEKEIKKGLETNVPDKERKKMQYEQIRLQNMLRLAEDVCQQGCPYCYIERFGNLEEYSNHIKQKSHINVKKLAKERSDIIIKEMVYNSSRPNTENGLEFIKSVEGYYCQLCHLFFCEEVEAKVNHCETETHNLLYKNLIENSAAIEKVLADELIKTQNQNFNGTEDISTQHSSKLSRDIRDLCLDKLEEVLAEKEQMSQSNFNGYDDSVMFTECSVLEKGFFAEQELREDIPIEVLNENRNSRNMVKKTNRHFNDINNLEYVPTSENLSTSTNAKVSKSLNTSSISHKMDISLPYTLSNINQCDIKCKYYGAFRNKNGLDAQNQKDSTGNNSQLKSQNDDSNKNSITSPQKDETILVSDFQQPQETLTAKPNKLLPHGLPSEVTPDIKCKYYGSYQDRQKPTNDSSSNSDDEYALTKIKDKVPDKALTDTLISTSNPQQFLTLYDALSNQKKKCEAFNKVKKGAHKVKPTEVKDSNCIQHPFETSTDEVPEYNKEEDEVKKSKTNQDEDLRSNGCDTDSNSEASSHTDVSNTSSTDNVNRNSTTNSCLSDADTDSDKDDDFNELDTTLKEDSLCYKCLKEFEENSNLDPDKNTTGNKGEDKSESNASALLSKECKNKFLTDLPENNGKSCLMENYISHDDLEHKNILFEDHDENPTGICDISLYSNCDKSDNQQIAQIHEEELEPIDTLSGNKIGFTNDLKTNTSAAIDSYNKTPNITKYSISVQKDLNLLTSDLDILPSTSFNYTTALDFDINGNSLVEHNDFEVDGFVVNEGILYRNILTQTYSMVTLYNNSYTCDEDHLPTEEDDVEITEREPPDGIEDKRLKLQVYETSSFNLDSNKNNCSVAGFSSLQDINLSAIDLDENELSEQSSDSNQTTHVDCEALIHVIDSVIGEQQQTVEKMILDSYNQPLDISAEEDSGKLDMACIGEENLNLNNTYYENEDEQLSGKKSDHQCDVANKDTLPAFSENKDDSGITDDYDEGFVCPRNSPHLWARHMLKQNQFSTNNLEKENENSVPQDSSTKCDTVEWTFSQEVKSHHDGLFSDNAQRDNVCFDDKNKEEIVETPLQCVSPLSDAHCNLDELGEFSTSQENGDLFLEETDIIIQVRNCDITIDTNETLSIDICEDTTVETSFIDFIE